MRPTIRMLLVCLSVAVTLSASSCSHRAAVSELEKSEELQPERVPPQAAYRQAKAGKAILVCAYDDNEHCRRLRLDDGITLKEFESNKASIPTDREIIFYCA